ncbi:MAG: glycosyltransferase family 2 protein [Gemmataceae bacterium]
MMKVSIVLPTYNRAVFLSQAFESIRAQTWTDWELIVVDDGSTDDTRAVVSKVSADIPQAIHYVYQENQGAYGARNTGLDHASGAYIAFFDSDDVWLPHHLDDCVRALEANPHVDWVYGACRIADFATGKVQRPNTFYLGNEPQPFMKLRSFKSGSLQVFEDPDLVRFTIEYGLYCGLQNSVIRRCVFDKRRFQTAYRNEAEDQLLVIRALASGHRIALIDNVHVVYNEHDQNSSAAGSDRRLDKHLQIYQAVAQGFADLEGQIKLSASEHRALRRRLNREFFWHLGYNLFWKHDCRHEALDMFRRGLHYWPWSWRCWKTYVLSLIRSRRRAGRQPESCAAPIESPRKEHDFINS